jgi:enoyl reductase
MSKVVVFNTYGNADVLQLVDADAPHPGAGQVRVRVKAAGVQPFDCLFRSGAAHQWIPARFPQRLGNEFAGIIDMVGEGVKAFSIADEVLGWAMLESYAEHVMVSAEQIVAKPAGMPWAEAGVLSASGQTAATALTELGVGKDDTVLIHAAAGGVGTFAVQLAKARGATVVGTASERNHGYLRSLGAIPVAYGDGLAERVRAVAPDGIDAALVAASSVEALQVSLDLVSDKRRIGTVSFQPAADSLGVRRLSTERSTAQLAKLTKLYTEGKLRVVIQREYPLAAAVEAHRAMETRHVRGKIVLTM